MFEFIVDVYGRLMNMIIYNIVVFLFSSKFDGCFFEVINKFNCFFYLVFYFFGEGYMGFFESSVDFID